MLLFGGKKIHYKKYKTDFDIKECYFPKTVNVPIGVQSALITTLWNGATPMNNQSCSCRNKRSQIISALTQCMM